MEMKCISTITLAAECIGNRAIDANAGSCRLTLGFDWVGWARARRMQVAKSTPAYFDTNSYIGL